MPYTALPDMRMPWDNDGTVVYYGTPSGGPMAPITGSTAIALNSSTRQARVGATGKTFGLWYFFPESREVTGHYTLLEGVNSLQEITGVYGSSDSTNGLDGTWETATTTFPAGFTEVDDWRRLVKAVSFTGPKRVVRIYGEEPSSGPYGCGVVQAHLYGEKAAGETPDDILFLDGLTSFAEFTAPEDFGDRPLGTTAVRTFKVKNASATKTANSVNLQCNDADFAMSTDNSTWVVTINIASLAAGASSSTLYVRNTTPDPGNALGPRFARIVAIVGSWS